MVDAAATLKPVVDGTAAAPAGGAAEDAAWRVPMPAETLEAARAVVRVDNGGAPAAGEGGAATESCGCGGGTVAGAPPGLADRRLLGRLEGTPAGTLQSLLLAEAPVLDDGGARSSCKKKSTAHHPMWSGRPRHSNAHTFCNSTVAAFAGTALRAVRRNFNIAVLSC